MITMGLFNKALKFVGNIRNLIGFECTSYMQLHDLKHQKSAVYRAAAISDTYISGLKLPLSPKSTYPNLANRYNTMNI